MTNQQLQLVQQTWKLLREVDPTVLGDVFYGQLFITYPALRPMFTGSMESQYKKFVDMLSIIVARLDRPTTVAQEIGQLARSHKGYGVKPEHYVAVKEALLWTLERGLGNDWNNAVQQAWVACYDNLAQSMREND
ncbi:hemoglobin [Spirosoma sp. HMF4905]|uniref:Hemoglobin n=1 Tax=Spirosoma arboris TaxID=2682092 RepID=A0A7K1S5R8_9BACT|nr:globin domain-containing protein [Spirosoma arboris]MVM29134.1 hemoglobin [Spirosoma arboris]